MGLKLSRMIAIASSTIGIMLTFLGVAKPKTGHITQMTQSYHTLFQMRQQKNGSQALNRLQLETGTVIAPIVTGVMEN